MNTRPVWTLLCFSLAWGVCLLSALVGAAFSAIAATKMCLTAPGTHVAPVVLVCVFAMMVLTGVFAFQSYLFRLGTRALLNREHQMTLHTFAFALLYGGSGACMIIRGLHASLGDEAATVSETVFGLVAVGLWGLLIILEKYGKRPR